MVNSRLPTDNVENHTRPLLLVPIIPKGKAPGRPLPLDLGRVELVRWWLKSCCRRDPDSKVKKRRRPPPCDACRSVAANSKYLSKSMMRLDESHTLWVTGKNVKCMYLNGEAIRDRKDKNTGIPIKEGDELSFRLWDSSSSSPWMCFQLCSVLPTVVTPESKPSRDVAENQTSCRIPDVAKETTANDFEDSVRMTRPATKRKRPDDVDNSSSPRSRRKLLFVSPKKQQTDEEEELLVKLGQRAFGGTVQSQQILTQRDPPVHNSFSSESSSIMALPQCPSSDISDHDDSQMEQHVNEIQYNSPVRTVMSPASFEEPSSSDWHPVSALSQSNWKRLLQKESIQPTSSFRRALLSLVVTQNSSQDQVQQPWLPALLQGTMIHKDEL